MPPKEAYPSFWQPRLLHQYYLQHIRTEPDKPAIVSAQLTWTYQQLYDYSAMYEEELRRCQLQVGDKVIIELDPCPQAIAFICACSKLGLVFIPISPDTPDARIHQIINLSEAKLYIQSVQQMRMLNIESIMTGTIKGNVLHIQAKPSSTIFTSIDTVLETDLAYIIFTSGTTGLPKGIMMTHKAVLAFYQGLVHHCQLADDFRVGSISPLQFDFSLLDMGLAFGSGATLVLVPKILVHQPVRFVQYLATHKVNQMNGVPSIWRMVLKHMATDLKSLRGILKSILYAGEAFPVPDMFLMREQLPDLRIINCFGQSESVACSFYDVEHPLPADTEHISIGYGHAGVEMLLFDEDGKEIHEPWVTGEIYLRGSSLFSGYWKNEQATVQALLPHPLRQFNGERVFVTGDLAFKGSNGEFYFKGRKDLQVKIRGNRVEIEEVERVLSSQPSVQDVAVVVCVRRNSPLLAAFVVPKDDTLQEQQLRAYCFTQLPSYMLPTHIFFVSHLPITINGKIDRKYLKSQTEQ